MNTAAIVVVTVAGAVVLYVAVRAVLGWREARGKRVVECPATHEPAAVELSRWRPFRTRSHEVRTCSDWPEREGCAQACLREIEGAPDGCRVQTLLTSWYEGQRCAMCGQPFGEIHWMDRPPAFVDSADAIRAWSDVRPEQLPKVLETDRPVCADCSLAARFRREHGDLVVDRPGRDPVQRTQ